MQYVYAKSFRTARIKKHYFHLDAQKRISVESVIMKNKNIAKSIYVPPDVYRAIAKIATSGGETWTAAARRILCTAVRLKKKQPASVQSDR